MKVLGNQNRFGGQRFDPFSTFNADFKKVFTDNPPGPGPNLSCGRKNCRRCRQYRPMAGGSNKGNVFICKDCNLKAKGA